MTKHKKNHAYTEWAKSRLDEMDATIFVLEDKVENLEADASKKAETALDEMRSWRNSFKARIDENLQNSEEAWADIKTHLDNDWDQFESSVQARISAGKDDAEQYKEAFKARAEAQVKGWQTAITELKNEAVKFKIDRSADVEKAIAKMKAKATDVEVKLDRLKKAESQTATALNSALSETRKAFEKANKKAHKAFKDALK
tara:strand:+ start:471 stop:1073 length:603 start_codon:yes stop_codon:yes gene_type:complete